MLHNDTLISNYVVFGIHPIWIFTCNLYRLFSGTKLTIFNSVPTDHSKHEAISDYFFIKGLEQMLKFYTLWTSLFLLVVVVLCCRTWVLLRPRLTSKRYCSI